MMCVNYDVIKYVVINYRFKNNSKNRSKFFYDNNVSLYIKIDVKPMRLDWGWFDDSCKIKHHVDFDNHDMFSIIEGGVWIWYKNLKCETKYKYGINLISLKLILVDINLGPNMFLW